MIQKLVTIKYLKIEPERQYNELVRQYNEQFCTWSAYTRCPAFYLIPEYFQEKFLSAVLGVVVLGAPQKPNQTKIY